MKDINLLFIGLIITCSSCCSQNLQIYQNIKNIVSNDTINLKKNLGLKDGCYVKLSSKIIPINTTPFYTKLDSLNILLKVNNDNPFSNANIFDYKNFREPYINKLLEHNENSKLKYYNVRLYCSDIINNLVTCEATEILDSSSNNELVFGKSLLYIFYFDENKTIKWFDSKQIINN